MVRHTLVTAGNDLRRGPVSMRLGCIRNGKCPRKVEVVHKSFLYSIRHHSPLDVRVTARASSRQFRQREKRWRRTASLMSALRLRLPLSQRRQQKRVRATFFVSRQQPHRIPFQDGA